MRVVILHQHFGFQSIFGISFEPYDEHRRILCAVVIYWLSSLTHPDYIKEFSDEASMSHDQYFDRLCLAYLHPWLFLGNKFVCNLRNKALCAEHYVMPPLTIFRLVLSKLDASFRCLALKAIKRRSFKNTTALLTQTRIEAYFSVLLSMAISLHLTDFFPSLPRAA